ncbi:MAG: DUF2971 domain-containing protein [Lachnospiraceae bacterium]|nr:DUF2971 domain-containing protein [Lachnospiraceae bacterium]
MFFENNVDICVKKQEQINYNRAYQINNGLLYHYAKCETLWSILESDSFFARNIRFSNDSNEYMTGRDTIEHFINEVDNLDHEQKNEILRLIRENPMMYFMVCFCKDGDLLSQWRGYAQNGVSIGLDFTDGIRNGQELREHLEWFCVLNNKKYQQTQKTKNKASSKNKYYIDNKTIKFLQMPYKVQYISKEDRIKGQIEEILNELWTQTEAEDQVNKLLKYIPFIKDEGFSEEEEYRLIFDMEFLGESKAHSKAVRSKKMEYLDSESMKKPYINVEFGQPENKISDVKKIRFGRDAVAVMEAIKRSDVSKNLILERNDKREGICLGEGSNQEKILEIIEKYIESPGIEEQDKIKIKIWCDGHLPIRKIVVGPGEKQREIKESLEYYKDTVYWLRYIDVEESKIPLRI